MTKDEIEAVLTGTVGSHNHILLGQTPPATATAGFVGQFYLDTAAPLLYQCVAGTDGVYAWAEVGKTYTLPQANGATLGGVKAAARAGAETSEVKIDPATGRLYALPPDAALNGLPSGGGVGQLLAKYSVADYDGQWVTGKVSFSATLTATGWAGLAAPYTQSIAIDGILEIDRPIIGPVYSGGLAAKKLERAAWALVDDIEAAAGVIVFTCFEVKPETDINIQGEVVRLG